MEKFGTDIILGENEEWSNWVEERQRYVAALVDKWEWLLVGTKKQKLPAIEEKNLAPMAILFENQYMYTKRYLAEATRQADVQLPLTYSLPIIRKVYPNLVAMRCASVQPMPMSSGGTMNVFYQDFLREDAGNSSLTVPDSDYAYNVENAVPKRIKMQILKQSVTAEKKILMASWSQEVEEDAMGALNIDVESELVTQAALEIQREIDQIVLAEILTWASAGNVNWNWTIPLLVSAHDHYQTLGHACIDMEDLIYGQRYRRGDYIIGGRRLVRFLRKMQEFKPEPRNQPFDPFKVGVELVGRVEGFWDVYLTAHINQDRGIMGVYPTSQTDSGYIFAPYIPLMAMPKVYAEALPYNDATLPGALINTDKWTRNVRTRFAKKFAVPQMFSTISIAA